MTMTICARCREYKGIEVCCVCGERFCLYCDGPVDEEQEAAEGPHLPDIHGMVYDMADLMDAARKRGR